MKFLAVVIAYLMAATDAVSARETALTDLADLRWKYRVILVFAPEAKARNAVANIEAFAAGIDERDIAWFVLDGAELHTNYRGRLGETLREQLVSRYFTPPPDDTAVLLIGKDGGVKSRTTDLDLEATFGLIDAMPMRRREMQQQGDGSE